MTTNELQTARDEHVDAQESLSVEFETEFGEIVTLRNALESADTLIAALEAHAAEQQQRIERLEAALEPFAETYRGFLPALTGNEYNDPFWEWLMDHADGALIGDHYQRAHDALRDEPGAE